MGLFVSKLIADYHFDHSREDRAAVESATRRSKGVGWADTFRYLRSSIFSPRDCWTEEKELQRDFLAKPFARLDRSGLDCSFHLGCHEGPSANASNRESTHSGFCSLFELRKVFKCRGKVL
jgi:hypothetical protein